MNKKIQFYFKVNLNYQAKNSLIISNKTLRIINIIIRISINVISQDKLIKSQKLTLNKEIIQIMTLLNYIQMQICQYKL